jgi:predicted permease
LLLFKWVAGQRHELLPALINGWLMMDEGGLRASTSISYPAYTYLRDRQQGFSDLVAFAETPPLLVRSGEVSDKATGQYVSGNYFRSLGVSVAAGRPLLPSDDRRDADAVAVISFETWQRRFGRSSAAVGAHVLINRVPVVIVGVMPRGFNGCLQVGTRPELTMPIALQPRITPQDGAGLDDAGYWWVQVMGRLARGTPPERATNTVALLFDQHVASLPRPAGAVDVPRLRSQSGSQGLVEKRRELASSVKAVAGLVCLVLLVATGNVAGLLLARTTARVREVALRLAMGASRARLVRQVFTESLTISLLGGAAGVVLSTWLGPLLLAAAQPTATEAVVEVPYRLDLTVGALGLSISVLVGIALGLLTVVGTSRFDVSMTSKEKGNGIGTGRSSLRLGRFLVVGQVAASLLLLVLAGLLVVSLRNVERVHTGIDVPNLLSFRVEPGLQG